MKIYNTKVLFLAIFILATTQLQAQKSNLKLKLAKGSTYTLQMATVQLISQEIMGQKQEIDQKISMTYTFNVENVNANGESDIKVTYKTFSISQQSPMGNLEYDSEKPSSSAPEAFKAFSGIVNESFTMKITPEGEIKKMEGVDKLIENIMKKFNVTDESQKQQLKSSLQSQFGEEALKGSMEYMMAVYPEKPVGVGDAWNKSLKIAMGIPMAISTVYTLKDRKNGVANLDVNSKIDSAEGEPMQFSGMNMTYQVSGDQKGTLQLDEKTGFTKNSDITQSLSGTLTLSGAPQMQEPMTLPIKITSHIVVKAL